MEHVENKNTFLIRQDELWELLKEKYPEFKDNEILYIESDARGKFNVIDLWIETRKIKNE